MTILLLRYATTAAICIYVTVGIATRASAQEVIITIYLDAETSGESALYGYAEAGDETDPQGATHYDYYSGANLWGSTGSDSDGGAGMGPWWLEVSLDGYDDDSYWEVEMSVFFTCSGMGPLGGVSPTEMLSIKTTYFYTTQTTPTPPLDICWYPVYQCTGGTSPSCGNLPHPIFVEYPSCPSYMKERFLYHAGVCSPVGLATPAKSGDRCT
jgi:hypothetical protein